jgi:hypothetical protein
MNLPSIPNTPIQALIVIGVALVIVAVLQPTDLYEQLQDAEAEKDREAAVLDIEKKYLDEEVDQASMRQKRMELEIRAEEVKWLQRRADNLRGRWEKARLWAFVGGTGGLVVLVCGMVIWWRRHPNGE